VTWFGIFTAALVGLKCLSQLCLEWLNVRHLKEHARTVPEWIRGFVDENTYAKSVDYTLAKGRLHQVELVYDAVILLGVLFSGLLPWALDKITHRFGTSQWAMGGFLFSVGILLAIPELPFAWYAQFKLEERFGFNTNTQRVWWADRVKGLLLALLLVYPLLVLILVLTRWTGQFWWIWAWAALMAFQLLMAVLAPVLILPLFNKLTPLPEGSLRDRLLALAKRTSFRAGSIQVMDGSKRSRHSNAFFTGFGRFRKIVLFDTLITQLTEPQLEAVLAHEIGHYKKAHIPKTLVAAALGSFAGFYALSWLASRTWFYTAFGFPPGNFTSALLIFGLLSGAATFWFSPVAHWWSRRHEYEADAFAATVMKEPAPLIQALRRLNEKNLSNLTPHPVYSAFYYSHPTLIERERALALCLD